MVDLRPMTEAEFAEYKAFVIEDYGQEIAASSGVSAAEARAMSDEQINRLLAGGLATPNMHLYQIVTAPGSAEQIIGQLWLDVNEAQGRCFIYDIHLDETARGQGWGTMTMLFMEEKLKARGIKSIGLHVFGDNTVAQGLYRKLGYKVTGLQMGKVLGE